MEALLEWVPPEWRGPVLLLVLAAAVVGVWPWRRAMAVSLVQRIGGSAPVEDEDESAEIDERVWREADIKASGLPLPLICIDRGYRVRVYNRAAEMLTGHPWNAAHGVDIGLLLTDADAALLRYDLDHYMEDRRSSAALRMVAERRRLHLDPPGDATPLPVIAVITDFGNGHGGWQIALSPMSLSDPANAVRTP